MQKEKKKINWHMNPQRKKIVAALLIGLLFGFIVGYGVGTYFTTVAIVKVASNFINIDYDLVEAAIGRYNGKVNSLGNYILMRCNNESN